jgi:hypothetical protein
VDFWGSLTGLELEMVEGERKCHSLSESESLYDVGPAM